jgi:hypothetical protein
VTLSSEVAPGGNVAAADNCEAFASETEDFTASSESVVFERSHALSSVTAHAAKINGRIMWSYVLCSILICNTDNRITRVMPIWLAEGADGRTRTGTGG